MSAVRESRAAPVRAASRPRLTALVSAWAPVALWLAVIFSLSGDRFSDVNTAVWLSGMPLVGALLPPAAIEVGNFIVRKCAHFVEYAVLGMLIFRALRSTRPRVRKRQLLAVAVGLAVLCASLDELRQLLATFTRSGTPRDVLLDGTGALAGALVGATYLYRRSQCGDA